jgi:hypothetical protein
MRLPFTRILRNVASCCLGFPALAFCSRIFFHLLASKLGSLMLVNFRLFSCVESMLAVSIRGVLLYLSLGCSTLAIC